MDLTMLSSPDLTRERTPYDLANDTCDTTPTLVDVMMTTVTDAAAADDDDDDDERVL